MPSIEEKYDNLARHIRTEKELKNSKGDSKATTAANIAHQKTSGAKTTLHNDSMALLNAYRNKANFADMISTQLTAYQNAKSSKNPKRQVYTALVIGTAIQDAFHMERKERKGYAKNDNLSDVIGDVVNKNVGLIEQGILQSRRDLAHNIGTRAVDSKTSEITVPQADIKDAEKIVGQPADAATGAKATGLYRLAEVLGTQAMRDKFKNARQTDYTIYQNQKAAAAAAAAAAAPAPAPAPAAIASTATATTAKKKTDVPNKKESVFTEFSREQSDGSSSSEKSKKDTKPAVKVLNQKQEEEKKEPATSSNKLSKNQRKKLNKQKKETRRKNMRIGATIVGAVTGFATGVAAMFTFNNKSSELNEGVENNQKPDPSALVAGGVAGAAIGALAAQGTISHVEKYQNANASKKHR